MNFGSVMTTLYEAIASLEENLPHQKGAAFGPGAVYDFFVALNEVVASATKEILIVDPFLDHTIFGSYLSNLKPGVSVRLLISKYAESVKTAAISFRAQHGNVIELRRSSGIHDRVVFLDQQQCWVLGASIKDAAVKKPTYLAPLPHDVVVEKVRVYETAWNSGVAI
jgi:hypothetical protein